MGANACCSPSFALIADAWAEPLKRPLLLAAPEAPELTCLGDQLVL